MPLSWELRGADLFIQQYGAFELAKALEEPFERGLLRMQGAMAQYPAPRTGSRYVRTGTLGRRWTSAPRVLTPLQGRVVNNTRYGPVVQRDPSEGQPSQAWMHQGRWQTDKEVMEAEAPGVLADCERTLEKMLG